MNNFFKSAVVAFVVVAVIFGCKDVSDKGIAPHTAVQTAADSSAVAKVHSPLRTGAALYVGYACTPKVNTSTTSSKVTLKTSCATFNAGLAAKVTSLSGSTAKITVSRADGKALGKDGTARLKLTNVCGTEVGNVAFKALDKTIAFTVVLTHTQGEVQIWSTATFNDQSRLYSEPIRFTVVEKSPTLPWDAIVLAEKDFGAYKNGGTHVGIDAMAAVDTEIKSAGKGTVHSYTRANAASFGAINKDLPGPAIWIQYTDVNGQPYYCLYGHIASSYTGTYPNVSYTVNLKAGSTVEDGQVIGKVAPFSNSGKRADHLHIGIYKPSKKTNGTFYGPPTSGWGYGTISRSPEGEFISPKTFFSTVRLKVN